MEEKDEVQVIRPQAGFQELFVKSNVDFVVGGGTVNSGKEQPLDSLVLTPDGWVRMGDLKVGDRVNTPFGGVAKVIAIYDHKDKDIYRITTNDGRSVECGYEHLWAIRTEKQKSKFNISKDPSKYLTVCETSELIKRMEEGKKTYIQIPYAQELTKKNLPIPPYVLGVMLGDGCLTEAAWKSKNGIIISSSEDDVIENVRRRVDGDRVYDNPLNYCKYIYTKNAPTYHEYCQRVGLTTYSHNKFIPEEYLYSSIEDRMELLRGLMDTDGCVNNGSFSYSTTSEKMKDGILCLCRGLGMRATVAYIDTRKKYKSGVCYQITISTFDKIFTSEKHTKKYNAWINKDRKLVRLFDHVFITSIDKVRVADTRCILIDDPLHLYVTNDFLTTHNTFGAVLSVAEPSLDPKFRAVFLRNNLDDLKAGGGILDTFTDVYGTKGCKVVESGNPHVDFPSGARVDVTHISDQTKDKILQRFKGRQYDMIYFDEGTGFTWTTFTTLYSRNRGTAKWTGKMRMTTNPKRSHWLRKFLDWYIGADGYIREDRNGVVRYFYINGERVDDVVWGDTKEEVYRICKVKIDRQLKRVNRGGVYSTYKDLIKSFTFYLGSIGENQASLKTNSGYVGSVAVMGEREALANLEGNWNVDADEDLLAPIPSVSASHVFLNDPARNGDGWVTADLADTGTDNFLALAWDGLHITDYLILTRSTPKMNAERLQMFAADHNIADNHIIFDAVRGTYILDYIPDAIPFVSYRAPMGMYGRMARSLKDECYLRLIECIKREQFSMEDSVALAEYVHIGLQGVTFQTEFLEECAVVRFKDTANGRKTLLSKKEMNALLGKGRSMDLLDPCAMRMLPFLPYIYGEELVSTTQLEAQSDNKNEEKVNVYDETLWA